MLYNSEITFIDKFIATLKVGGVSQIPFDTPAFYNGVDRMGEFFALIEMYLAKYQMKLLCCL